MIISRWRVCHNRDPCFLLEGLLENFHHLLFRRCNIFQKSGHPKMNYHGTNWIIYRFIKYGAIFKKTHNLPIYRLRSRMVTFNKKAIFILGFINGFSYY